VRTCPTSPRPLIQAGLRTLFAFILGTSLQGYFFCFPRRGLRTAHLCDARNRSLDGRLAKPHIAGAITGFDPRHLPALGLIHRKITRCGARMHSARPRLRWPVKHAPVSSAERHIAFAQRVTWLRQAQFVSNQPIYQPPSEPQKILSRRIGRIGQHFACWSAIAHPRPRAFQHHEVLRIVNRSTPVDIDFVQLLDKTEDIC